MMSQLPNAPPLPESNPPGYEEVMGSSLTSGVSWSPPGTYIPVPHIGWTPEVSGTSWTPPVPQTGTPGPILTPAEPPHIGWNETGTSWNPDSSVPHTSWSEPSSDNKTDVCISKQPIAEEMTEPTDSQGAPVVDVELPVSGILAACPTCRTFVPASVKHKPSCATHTVAVLFCVVGLIPCALFTYLCPPCMKSDHYCDVCGTKIESTS